MTVATAAMDDPSKLPKFRDVEKAPPTVNTVLIIIADAIDAKALCSTLEETKNGSFVTDWKTTLAAGLQRLEQGGIDAVMVDLSLPDCSGMETFDRLFAAAPRTPIMTLCLLDEDAAGVEMVEHGAWGYVAKASYASYLVAQSLRNIIQRSVAEEAVFIEKARAEITLNSISDAVIGTDMAGKVDYLNIAAEGMTGWTREEAKGRSVEEVMRIVDAATRQVIPNPVERVLKEDAPMGLAPGAILIRRDGSEAAIEDSAAPIHDSRGRIKGAVMVFHDVTAAQAMVLKMAHLAQHDFLTNLPNRVLLSDRLAQAIILAERRGTQLALLFLDLDHFKYINDSLGHETGDKLLQSVAQSLIGCVRRSDTVCRIGGDEFVVLMAEEGRAEDAAITADKIILALSTPHTINGHELIVTASIGISAYPGDGRDAETLLKNADTAMYQAKERGRGNFQFYKAEMNARAVERQAIESDLRRALLRQEFSLHYQPLVSLANRRITGAEALLRWESPSRGEMAPGMFVPIAEDSGLIVAIGRWVLREACAQTKKWHDLGLDPGIVSVNVSALEFRRKDFVDSVRLALLDTGLWPGAIQLEITESVLMNDVESSTRILGELKGLGVSIAVDDFGTGYSSLSYLSKFPIDVLKIDRSFINAVGNSESDSIIVSAVIAMGANLKQRVVAEGVEEVGQVAFLKAECCEEAQGFLFSRPLTSDRFAALLRSGITDEFM